MKKILFILSSVDAQGGIQRSLNILSDELCMLGYSVDIISFKEKEVKTFIFNKFVKIHYMHFLNRAFLNPFISIKNIYKLRKVIKKINPSLIFSYERTPSYYSFLTFLNIEKIASERNSFESLTTRETIFNRLFYPFFKKVTFVSKKDSEFYSYLKNKEVLYNPLVKKNDSLNKKENIILAVGRLSHQKGFDLILSRIDELNLFGWRFIILGEGPELDNLKTLSKGKVEFHGFQDPHEYYVKSKIFILPSRYEGFPNVLAEAMQYGCAPIAFDCNTGPSEILTKENGILVENKNVDEFIKAINFLIKNEELRISIAQEAENNDMFSTEKHVTDFLRIIR